MSGKLKSIYFNKLSIVILLAMLILYWLAFYLIGKQSLLRINQFNFYNRYDSICESDYLIDNNSYYNVSEYLSIHQFDHNHDEECKCAIYSKKIMQCNDFTGQYNLKENEVIISKNIAIKYSLDINSKIYIFDNLSDGSLEFCVNKIMDDYVYGLLNVDFNNPSGLIIIGYNSSLVNPKAEFIKFIDNNDEIIDLNNIRINNLKNEDNKLLLSIVIMYGSLFLSLFVINIIMYKVISTNFFVLIKARRRMGEYYKIIKKDIFLSLIPLLFVMLLSSITPFVLLIGNGSRVLFILTINIVIVILNFMFLLLYEFRKGIGN